MISNVALQKDLIEPIAHVDGPFRVLLVDDDEDYGVLFGRMLNRVKFVKFLLTVTSDISDLATRCLCEKYDCLIVDYRLPNTTGTRVTDTLKEKLGELAPPIVILTAFGGEQAATNAVRVGAADFLSKSDVNPESLQRSITNAIEKGRLKNAIHARNLELNQLTDELRRQNKEIQSFYHNVSHEIKTPLTAVREFVSLLHDGIAGPVSPEQRELLAYALEGCDQINRQFNDLFDLTRLETGKYSLDRTQVCINTLVAQCALVADIEAKNRNIKITSCFDESLDTLCVDRLRMAQVITNLLNNAVKFTPDNGQVNLATRFDSSTNRTEISVSDTGCGIPEDQLAHIFDRLYQVNSGDSSRNPEGLGLGLSIAQKLVEQHGGEIVVESEIGKGSRFIVRL